jgi:hypothetical protein
MSNFEGTLMMFANVYGLTVLVFMLGFGLFQFPMHIYKSTQDQKILDIMVSKLPTMKSNTENCQKNMIKSF